MNIVTRSAVAALAALSSSFAQAPAAGGRGPAAPPKLEIRQIKPNFYMVTGAGANSGVRVVPGSGIILVDGKLPGNYDALMAQIRSVTQEPIRDLIVTHHHVDHTGNNAGFLAAGVPIIAHENLNKNLTTYQTAPPIPPPATITYTTDYTVKVGNAEAKVYHFGPGHTSGDSVVFFPDLKIIMLSDVVTTGATGPLMDYASGGSALEWPKVLESILTLDFDTAIAGNGDPLTKADVATYKTKYELLLSRAKAQVAKGTPKEDLLKSIRTDDIGFNFRLNGTAIDSFIAELSK